MATSCCVGPHPQLDVGTDEKTLLMNRSEDSMLVVRLVLSLCNCGWYSITSSSFSCIRLWCCTWLVRSYADLKRCVEDVFRDLQARRSRKYGHPDPDMHMDPAARLQMQLQMQMQQSMTDGVDEGDEA